jgi:hypothetical protein
LPLLLAYKMRKTPIVFRTIPDFYSHLTPTF